MAQTRREIVKELIAQGIGRKEAEAHATKILAESGDVIVIGNDGKERQVDPGPSIFDV